MIEAGGIRLLSNSRSDLSEKSNADRTRGAPSSVVESPETMPNPSLARSRHQPTQRPYYGAASQTSGRMCTRSRGPVLKRQSSSDMPAPNPRASPSRQRKRVARRRGGAERGAVSVGPKVRGACAGSSLSCHLTGWANVSWSPHSQTTTAQSNYHRTIQCPITKSAQFRSELPNSSGRS